MYFATVDCATSIPASAVRREYGECPTVGWPAHLPDQVTNLAVDRWAAHTGTKFPAKVGSKPATLPADYGLGHDNSYRTKYGRKEPIQPDKHQRSESASSIAQLASEDVELLMDTRCSASSRVRDIHPKLSAYASYLIDR